MLMTKESQSSIRTLRGWAISLLHEACANLWHRSLSRLLVAICVGRCSGGT